MPKHISLIVPSRGRPQSLMRMLNSAIDTAIHPDTVEAVVLLDQDDTASLILKFGSLPVVRLVRNRTMSMGQRTLDCIEAAAGEIYFLVNDDVVVRTQGWDDIVRSAAASFPDGIYLLYPNDEFKNGALPTFPIVSRSFISNSFAEALKEYQGAFLDFHIFEIFQRLRKAGHDRIRYLDNVVFEHMHYRTGKSNWDETYARRARFGDDATVVRLAPYRIAAAERLQRYIEHADTDGSAIDLSAALNSRIALALELAMDPRLPVCWRFRTALWFVARSTYQTIQDLRTTFGVGR